MTEEKYEDVYKNRKRFSFGKNWRQFLKVLNDERIEEAKKSLLDFFGENKINGKSFVDVGSGSGLFSLCAAELGADKLTSIDIDDFSLECTNYLKEKYKKQNWKIMKGSALDKKFLHSLGKFDIVYSWGVLHHTGKMWEAIDNVSHLVKDGGIFYLAIYNKKEGLFGSKFWLKLKKTYNKSGIFGKKIIEGLFICAFFAWNFVTFQNPFKKISSYKSKRGMSWYYDVVDGLGGYPYEFASPEEVFHFMKKKGFELENIKTTTGIENNEFLFRKRGDI